MDFSLKPLIYEFEVYSDFLFEYLSEKSSQYIFVDLKKCPHNFIYDTYEWALRVKDIKGIFHVHYDVI